MIETWINIINYEKLYEVSNKGNVRSKDRVVTDKNGKKYHIVGKEIKPKLRKDGYLDIRLSKNNKQKSIKLHRIVAMAFIKNPDNKLEVNHIDEDKQNNNVNNLEWVTRKENINWGTAGQRRVMNTNYSLFNKKIIGKRNGQCIVFSSINFAAKVIGGTAVGISSVLHGYQKTTRGWTFSFYKHFGGVINDN